MTELNLETPKAPGQKDAPDPSLGGPIRHIVASAHKWGGNGTKPDFNKIKRVLLSKHPEVIAKAFGGHADVAAAWIKDNWAASHGISFPGKTGSGPTYWRKGGNHMHASNMLCSWWQPAADEVFLGGDDEAELYLADDTAVIDANGLIWKTILREGTWKRNPMGPEKPPLVIDRPFMEDLIAANKDGAWEFVTIPLTHADRVHENTGFVRQLKIVDQGGKTALRAGLEFTEPDIKQKVLNRSIANVSVGVGFNVSRTDNGKTYPRVLKHVALTNQPWINGLPAFGSEDMAAGKVDPASVKFAYVDETEDLSEAPLDFSALLHIPEVIDWPISAADRVRSKVDDLVAAIEDVYSTDSVGNVEIRRNIESESQAVAKSAANIVGDGSSGNDDDDDSIGFPADVHHMDSSDPVVNCSSCIFFANQTCSKWNAATEATDVCDSYENVAGEQMGDKGSIDALNVSLNAADPDNDGDVDIPGQPDTDVGQVPIGHVFGYAGGRYTVVGPHPTKKHHTHVRKVGSVGGDRGTSLHDQTQVSYGMHASISTEERAALPITAFAVPATRSYPIHTRAFAEKALRALGRAKDAAEAATVKAAVYKRYPDLKPSMAASIEIVDPTADEMLLAQSATGEYPLSSLSKGDVFVSHHGHTYAHMGPHPVKKNHIAAVHTSTGKMTSFPHGMVVKKVTTPMPAIANNAGGYLQVGPPSYASFLSKGGDHMSEENKDLKLTRDELDRIVSERVETELNAAREAAKTEAAEERKALELELSRNRRAVHEMTVRERVTALNAAGHAPAVVKVAQELMLADDRGEAMLTLSREGGEVKLSITDAVNELLEAFPKSVITTDQPRKLDLSKQPESGEDSVEAANKDYEALFGAAK